MNEGQEEYPQKVILLQQKKLPRLAACCLMHHKISKNERNNKALHIYPLDNVIIHLTVIVLNPLHLICKVFRKVLLFYRLAMKRV